MFYHNLGVIPYPSCALLRSRPRGSTIHKIGAFTVLVAPSVGSPGTRYPRPYSSVSLTKATPRSRPSCCACVVS